MFAFDAKPEGGREDIGERPPPRGVTGETLPLRPLSRFEDDEGLFRESDSTNEFLSIAADVKFSNSNEAAEVVGKSPRLSSMLGIGNGGGKNRSPIGGR